MIALLLAVVGALPLDVPGSWGEPTRAVFLDPAARPVLSGLNAVGFDGLAPASTAFVFDGLLLKTPAHALFGPSTLHPGWLESIAVGPSVETAERGRSLGRFITLTPREPRDHDLHTVIRVDLLQTGLFVERALEGGTRLQGAVRFFPLVAAAGAVIKGSLLLGDYQLRVVQPVGAGSLRVLALGALDSVGLTFSGIPLAARLQGHQLDVRWSTDALELGLSGHLNALGLTLNGPVTKNAIDGQEQGLALRALVRGALSEHATATAGLDLEVRRLLLARGTTIHLPDGATAADQSLRSLGAAVLGGLFARVRLTEGAWTTDLGLRADLWKPADASAFLTLDPRLTTSRPLGDRAGLELAVGLMHQAPSWLVPVPVLESAALRFGVQEAVQASVRTWWAPWSRSTFDARLFGTAITHGLEFSPFDADFLQVVNLVDEVVERKRTSGWAAGGEVRYRFDDPAWGWAEVSYGLQQSWRFARFDRLGLDGLPVGQAQAWVPFALQQTHALRLAGGVHLPLDWKVGLSALLMTGPPLVGGLFSQDQRAGVDSLTGAPRWVPIDRDQVGAAGAWVRVDARVSKTWHPASWAIELFLDVQNASVWAQPTGTNYGTAPATLEQQARGELNLTKRPASSPLPPVPVLGLELRR